MTSEAPAPRYARFVGTLAQAWFTTELDLSDFLPPSLEVVDPHRGFVKAYELKMRVLGTPTLPPAFSQYTQVAVSMLCRPAGTDLPLMTGNLFMWEGRGWSMGTGGLAWEKKLADIEITRLFPVEDLYRDDDERPFRVDVSSLGNPVMLLDGELDGIERIAPPPLDGFYLESQGGATLYHLALEDSYLGPPKHGRASLSFRTLPNEQSLPASVPRDEHGKPLGQWSGGVLGDVDCEGLVVQDVMFLRDFAGLRAIERPSTTS